MHLGRVRAASTKTCTLLEHLFAHEMLRHRLRGEIYDSENQSPGVIETLTQPLRPFTSQTPLAMDRSFADSCFS